MPSSHELGVEGKNQNFSSKEDSSQSPKHKVVACNSVQKKLACDVFLPIKGGGSKSSKYSGIKYELPENASADKAGLKFKDTFHP